MDIDHINEFLSQLSGLVQNKINMIHTAIPGEITAFDYEKCTASVLPLTKYILSDGTEVSYPVIHGVPFVFPQSSDVSLTFPVKIGDTCLLIFCENALDRWRKNGMLDSRLKFSLSNAIAIPGLFSAPNNTVREATEGSSVVVSAGNCKLKVNSSGVEITGSVTINGDLTVTGNINSGSINTQSVNAGSCNLV